MVIDHEGFVVAKENTGTPLDGWKSFDSAIEAANLGEALSGLAIMFTLLFGIRQVMEVNRNRRYEISQVKTALLELYLIRTHKNNSESCFRTSGGE